MSTASRVLDRIEATFDNPAVVPNAGLLLVATLISRLGLEELINTTVRLGDREGAVAPGRKLLTLVCAIVAGGTHIDHVDMLRAGATRRVLGFTVMAPSTIGTFLRAFTFGHLRQLDAVADRVLQRAWSLGAGPAVGAPVVIDIDSTITEVHGHHKHGAAYGYTRQLGYHPLIATLAGTGEVLHSRMRKGSAGSSRGVVRFTEELIARVRRAGVTGEVTVRADSGFWSWKLVDTLNRAGVSWSITVRQTKPIRAAIAAIPETTWVDIHYTISGTAQVAECNYSTGQGRKRRTVRLVVRRTRLVGPQAARSLTGDTTRSSPTPASTPPKQTGSTATTPSSSSQSASSKAAPGSSTAHPGTSSRTAPGSPQRCSLTTCCAGPTNSATRPPTGHAGTTTPCAPDSSASPPHW